MERRSAVILALCFGVQLNVAPATTVGENTALDALYLQARSTLDSASGQADFTRAATLLEQILEQDESYAPAYVELARLMLKTSYTFSSGPVDYFNDYGIEQAQLLLDTALGLEPGFADTLVLYGYVATSMDHPSLALISLDRAERLGSDSLWLHLNRAHVHEVLDNRPAARSSYLAVKDIAPDGSSEYISALESLTRVAEAADEIDFYYLDLMRVMPRDPSIRAAYSDFLRQYGHLDEALQYARSAFELGARGLNAASLAVALYAKAGAIANTAPQDARALIAEGELTGYPASKGVADLARAPATRPSVLGLADLGVDIDDPLGDGETVLFLYIYGDAPAEDLAPLLAHGVDVNRRNRSGFTPLHYAVMNSPADVVELLLESGADPNMPRYDGAPLIDVAIDRGDDDVTRLLERAGAIRPPNPSPGIVAGVDRGDPAQIDRAIKYLHFEDPGDLDVLAALQNAVTRDPLPTLQLTEQLDNVREQMCGQPATVDAATLVERLAAVEELLRRDPMPPPRVLITCRTALMRAQNEPTERPLPAQPTDEERARLLAAAEEELRNTRGNDRRFGRAREILQHLTATDRSDAVAHYLAAEVWLLSAENAAIGKPDRRYDGDGLDQAIYHLEAALRHDPEYADALALYAHALLHLGHAGLGRVLLDRALEIDGTASRVRLRDLEFATIEGRFAGAERELRSFAETGSDLRIKREAARLLVGGYAADGDIEGAEVTFDAWVALDPEDARPIAAYTRFLLSLEKYQKAAEIGRKLNDIGRHRSDNDLFAQALLAYGSSRLSLGETTEAAELFSRAKRLRPDLAPAIVLASTNPATHVTLRGLYAAGLVIDVPDEEGNTPLFHAVQRGDAAAVAELLSMGSDVMARNAWGLNPLQLALALQQEDLALALLAAGTAPHGELPDGSRLDDAAYSLGLDRLYARLEEAYAQRYPDWDTFLAGVRAAQPVHLARALTLVSQPPVNEALQAAFVDWPRTVVEVAAAARQLDVVCGSAAATTSANRVVAMRARLEALDHTRATQSELGLTPSDEDLDACRALLVSQ